MDDWRTYDDVAETYERVHATRFLEVANDLVAQAGIVAGGLVLDIGTGTGVAAEAVTAVGARAVGVDESIGMLRVARRQRPQEAVAAAEAIDLPFRNGVFDAAIGNFVLAHFTKYETAIYDAMRVLRTGGTIGFSSWSDGVDAYQAAWQELVESVVPREILEPAYAEARPWHEKFRKRDQIEEVLLSSGLRHVRTETRKYRWVYGREEYLDGMSVFASGRFVREMLGESGWASLRSRASAVFADRFPDPLNDFRDVILATATKV
jgi:ubiquinone/menaquinone biosynthesis C-methylase UbiE